LPTDVYNNIVHTTQIEDITRTLLLWLGVGWTDICTGVHSVIPHVNSQV